MSERWTMFHRADTKPFSRDRPCVPYEFWFPPGTTLEQALQQAYAGGLPKGSARAGCVEIQTDAGIYQSPTGGRINPKTVVFKTWEELEREEEKETDPQAGETPPDNED